MQISLDHPARKSGFLVLVLLAALLYSLCVSTQYLGSYFGKKADPASLWRAIKLDPWNAEYRYSLGRYFFLIQGATAEAIPSYEAAARLNPQVARYWLALASAYETQGDAERQQQALEKAIAADPKTPDVAWQAANLFVVRGESEKALQELSIVVENDPSLGMAGLQLARHIADTDTILRQVLPSNPQGYYSFLEILASQHQTADAIKAWNQLIQLRQPIEKRRVFEYVTYMVAQKEVDQARLAWEEAAELSGLSAYQPSPANLIVNGDFSLDVLNGGFDWLYQKSKLVSLALDPTQFREGHRSLRLVFDARSIEDAGIRQLIPVEPNTTYDFSAYFKAGDIEGAGGPRFVFQDLYDGKMYYASDELKDADFWKPVSGGFTTDNETKLLVLRIQRFPAGSPIKGTLWVDGLRLTEKKP